MSRANHQASNHTGAPHPGPAPYQPIDHTTHPNSQEMTYYQQTEMDQYAWLMHQIDNFGEHLEGMKYGTSRAEDQFKKCATIGVIFLLLFMLGHQILKFLRFKETEWQPNMNLYKIPDGIKTMLNMMEKEMAPTFMVITFLISVGSFYGFAIINFTCIVVVFLMMFAGYAKVNNDVIKCSRILLVMFTLALFLSLLADNHIFEESTLPQKIESHMTQQAKKRHAPHYRQKNQNKTRKPEPQHANQTAPGKHKSQAPNPSWNDTKAEIHSNYTKWQNAHDVWEAGKKAMTHDKHTNYNSTDGN